MQFVAAAGERGASATLLREALALWRGPALDDITLPGIRALAEGLDERMVSALEDRIDCDLVSGRHDRLVGELSGLVRTYPLRERLWPSSWWRGARRTNRLRRWPTSVNCAAVWWNSWVSNPAGCCAGSSG